MLTGGVGRCNLSGSCGTLLLQPLIGLQQAVAAAMLPRLGSEGWKRPSAAGSCWASRVRASARGSLCACVSKISSDVNFRFQVFSGFQVVLQALPPNTQMPVACDGRKESRKTGIYTWLCCSIMGEYSRRCELVKG